MERVDEDLRKLEAWKSGDEAAGRALFAALFDDLFAFFRNKSCDPEDLVQRTLLGCLESLDRYEQRSSLRVYVFSIAKNQLYSYWRRHGAQRRETDLGSMSFADLAPTPSAVLDERREHGRLAAALRHIPIEDQMLLESYYWQSLTARELAEVLSIAEAGVRSRLRRALQRLRDVVHAEPTIRDESTLATIGAWAASLPDPDA